MTRRITKFIVTTLLAITLLLPVAQVSAVGTFSVVDSRTITVDTNTLSKGYTISVQSGEAKIGIPSQSAPQPYNISVTSIVGYPGTPRANELHVGPVLQISHTSSTPITLSMKLNVQRTNRHFRIWVRRWNEKSQTWDRIRNTVDDAHNWVTAKITEPGIYTSFESTTIQEGKASWFRHSKKMVAAHNFYPIGTSIKVTNLDNRKSVVVKIVSTGPFVTGRAVDLSYDAFMAIAKIGGGIAPVSITAIGNTEPTQGVVLGETVPAPSVATLPPVTFDGQQTLNEAAGVKAVSYVAIHTETGKILTGKNAQNVRPLASLTKLMTAMVVLDTKPNMDAVMEYTRDDNADGAKLYMPYGEKVKVRDLFYTSLVGSANNATKLLSRASGLSKAEFVRRMNQKATSLGLSHTSFVEPTGLEQGNVSTAYEYALLARQAFSYPEIKKASLTPSYSFTTAGTKAKHTIKNIDKMLKSGWALSGVKTGYIDEARYCLVSSVVGKTTKTPVIGVILGSPTDSTRYADMDTILQKAFTVKPL